MSVATAGRLESTAAAWSLSWIVQKVQRSLLHVAVILLTLVWIIPTLGPSREQLPAGGTDHHHGVVVRLHAAVPVHPRQLHDGARPGDEQHGDGDLQQLHGLHSVHGHPGHDRRLCRVRLCMDEIPSARLDLPRICRPAGGASAADVRARADVLRRPWDRARQPDQPRPAAVDWAVAGALRLRPAFLDLPSGQLLPPAAQRPV